MAKLYKNFITRQLKFSNRESMLTYMEGRGVEVNVEGCFVTNTSSYVDISLEASQLPEKLFDISSILFQNSGDYTDYIAYIDRIEPNNFNEENGERLYYRLYITIDWWSTVMYNDIDGTAISAIKENIEGGVVRAHVDDYEKRGEDVFPTMAYTTDEAEFEISRYYNISEPVVEYGQGNRKFVYIFATKPPFTAALVGVYPFAMPSVEIGNKKIKCGQFCYLGVLAKDNSNTPPITLEYKLIDGDENAYTVTTKLNYMFTTDFLVDSDVVSLSCSDFNPFLTDDNNKFLMTEEEGSQTGGYGQLPSSDFDAVNFETLFHIDLEGASGEDIGGIIMRPIKAKKMEASRFNVITKGNYNFRRTSYYEDFLASIPKQHFAPYTNVCVKKGDEKLVLDTAYINEGQFLFDYVYVPWLGNYIIYAPTELNGGAESAYTAFCNNTNFERVSTSDEYTSAQLMAKKIGLIGSALGLGTAPMHMPFQRRPNPFSTAMGVASGITSIIAGETALSAEESKKLKQGENGTKLIQGSSNDFVSPLCVDIVKPSNACIDALRKDLALYGYNTYLHLHEVLVAHKRQEFNYVKSSNADIKLSSYSTAIRNAIEEMFNNGVWLWNNPNTFGNFEVPNYPIILESNNV